MSLYTHIATINLKIIDKYGNVWIVIELYVCKIALI